MPNASTLKLDSAQYRGLFVGRSGVGKKSAAASFPGQKRYFDLDQRVNGLLGCPWLGDLSNVDYDIYYPKETDFLSKLNRDLDKVVTADAKGKPEFDMVIFSSLTGFTNGLMGVALPQTHQSKGDRKVGKYIGSVAIPGPEDYAYEKIVTNEVLTALRALKQTNFIVTAHVVARFGKSDPKNPFSETIEIGEKLNITDKLGESALIYFNEIYGFKKKNVGDHVEHLVRFRSDLYRTMFSKIPDEELDITGKNFHETLKKYMV